MWLRVDRASNLRWRPGSFAGLQMSRGSFLDALSYLTGDFAKSNEVVRQQTDPDSWLRKKAAGRVLRDAAGGTPAAPIKALKDPSPSRASRELESEPITSFGAAQIDDSSATNRRVQTKHKLHCWMLSLMSSPFVLLGRCVFRKQTQWMGPPGKIPVALANSFGSIFWSWRPGGCALRVPGSPTGCLTRRLCWMNSIRHGAVRQRPRPHSKERIAATC